MPLIDLNFEKFLYDGSSWYGIDGGENHLEHVPGIPTLGLLCILRAHRRQSSGVCVLLWECVLSSRHCSDWPACGGSMCGPGTRRAGLGPGNNEL